MRTVLLLIRKDLLRKARSPLGIIVMLAFPVVFALIIALVFGDNQVPRVHLLVENRDDGFLGNSLMSALDSNEVAKYFDLEIVGEEGLERIQKGKASALLRVPENFTEDVIDGTPTSLELMRNPAQGIMPEIAEQVAGVLTEVLSAGSRVLREPLDTISTYTEEDAPRMADLTVAELAVSIKGTLEGAEDFLFPVVIDLESVDLGATDTAEEEEDSSPPLFSIFLFVFPGVSVWSLFMVGDLAMRDIVTEAEAGTLRRQLQGPIGAATLILSKAGYTAVVCLICLAILTVTGWIASDRPVSVVGFVVLSLALVFACTGAGATVYGAAGTENRGSTIASAVYLILGFAGGSFITIQSLPAAMRAIAPVSPFYWGIAGYNSLIQDQAGVAAILPSVAALTALGVVLLAIGSLLLKRRMVKGSFA